MEEEQEFATWTDVLDLIDRRHKTMVRRVLEQVEAAMPDGRQQKMFKKHVQIPIYDFRRELQEILATIADG